MIATARGVIDIRSGLLQQLNAASRIASECSENCEWKANLQSFKLDVILGAYDIQGIFLAKDNGTVMQQKNFPPEADRKKMTDAFNANYSAEWRTFIQMKVRNQH